MSNIAIHCEGLSKQYRIGKRERYRALRDVLTDAVSAPWRRVAQRAKRPFSPSPRLPVSSSDFWALDDVSFEVHHGEVVGIIGRNGAGKSTLLKILSRITEPTRGFADINGRVGSLLEVGTGFHPELTGRENIYLNGAILGMKRAEIERRFDEIVAFAETEKFLDTPVKYYSSGMQMRLAFAVAAHLDPEILLVDEVLAVGDAQFQKKCLAKIQEVGGAGRTILFVSHNMVAVRTLCNRVLLLDEGNLERDGLPVPVVSTYLDSGRQSRAELSWLAPSKAPGNELFRMHAIRIRREDARVSSRIHHGESFGIEIEYWNLVSGSRLGTTVIVHNDEGVCVFSSLSNRERSWHGMPRPDGLFRSTCRVPANLLVEGNYFVSVLVWGDNYKFAHREDSAVQFEIHEDGESRGDYFGGWSGVINPALEWTAELLETQEDQKAI
jgi:lipopolysaccharide transport system ATP-binding protein